MIQGEQLFQALGPAPVRSGGGARFDEAGYAVSALQAWHVYFTGGVGWITGKRNMGRCWFHGSITMADLEIE